MALVRSILSRLDFVPVLVAVLWGASFVSIRALVETFPPLVLVSLRYAGAAALFLLIALLGGFPLRAIRRADWPRFGLLVVLAVPAYHLALTYGEVGIRATTASLISQATPLLTVLFMGVAGRGWPTGSRWFGYGLAGLGTALVIAGGGLGAAGGEDEAAYGLITLGAPAALALYTMLAGPLVQRYGSATLTAQLTIAGALLFLPVLIFDERVPEVLVSAGPFEWAALASLTVLSTVVAYFLWNYALTKRTPDELSAYLNLRPLFAAGLAALLLDELPGLWQLVGGLAAIGGLALTQRGRQAAESLKSVQDEFDSPVPPEGSVAPCRSG